MSKFKQCIIDINLNNLIDESIKRKENNWRYVQTLAAKCDDGTDLIYSFMKDGQLDNVKISNVTEDDIVPSITDQYIEAFVWENEIHDLFNIKFDGIALDFKGNFYNISIDAPMTILGPEAIKRKELQAKVKAAKLKKQKNIEEVK